MTREQIIEALWRCTFIGEDGYLNSKCEWCPMVDEDWKKDGFAACRAYSDLPVGIPYELAEMIMKELREATNDGNI